jgi:hypothetical protein
MAETAFVNGVISSLQSQIIQLSGQLAQAHGRIAVLEITLKTTASSDKNENEPGDQGAPAPTA